MFTKSDNKIRNPIFLRWLHWMMQSASRCSYTCLVHAVWILQRGKSTSLVVENGFAIHHDSALFLTVYTVRDFLAKNHSIVLEQPPYSLDFAPSDSFLFPKLNLETIIGINAESSHMLKEILMKDCQVCFHAWKQRLHQCICVSGDYFPKCKLCPAAHFSTNYHI